MKKMAPKDKALLLEREKPRQDSIIRVEKARQDSIVRMEKVRQESLVRMEKARQDSIAAAEKSRKDSIAVALEIYLDEKFPLKPSTGKKEKAVKDDAARKKAEKEDLARRKAEKDRIARIEKARKDSIAAIKDEKKRREAEEKAFQQKVTSIIKMEKVSLDTASLLREINRRLKEKPGQSRLLRARGIISFFRQDYEGAKNSLIKLKPTNNTNRILALCFYHLGDDKNAVKYFKTVTKKKIEAQDRKKYCLALIRLKQPKTAAWEYEELLKQLPEDEDALAYLIKHYRKPLNKTRLISKLETYAKIHPQDTVTYRELSDLYSKSHPGKSKEYKDNYLKLVHDFKKAELEKAKALEKKGKKKEALKIYLKYAPDFSYDYRFNITLADKLLAVGKKQDAVFYLETAWALKSTDHKVASRLGRLYQEQKQVKKAMNAYADALKLEPGGKDLQNRYIKLVSGLKDPQERKKAYLFVVFRDTSAHQAQFLLAELYLKEKNRKAAYESLQQALKLDPKNNMYLKLLPWTIQTDDEIRKNFSHLKIIGKKFGADLHLKMLLARGYALHKDPASARKYYQQVYQKDKKLLKGRKGPIITFYNNKKYKLAAKLAGEYLASTDSSDRKIKEIQVKSLENSKAGNAELRRAIKELIALDAGTKAWWLNLARLDLAAKDTAAAIKHAKIWIERNPESINGYSFILPLVSGRKGEEKTYQIVLNRLIKTGPKDKAPEWRLELGFFLYWQKNLPEAEKLLSKSSKKYPKNARLWYTLGKIYETPGFKGNGKEQFKKAYELEPKKVEYVRTYASFLNSHKEIKENLKLFKFLVKNKPEPLERIKLAKAYYLNEDYAYSARAWGEVSSTLLANEVMAMHCYLKLGQVEEVLKYAKNFPNDYELNLTLARKLVGEGRKKDAIHFFKTAWALKKSDPAILKEMAAIYEYLLQKDKALEVWKQYSETQLKAKKRSEVKLAYEHMLKLGKFNFTFTEKLLTMYLEDGDLDKLEAQLKAIIAKQPKFPDAHFWMAKMYLKRNQSGMALEPLHKAIKLAPGNIQYIELLGGIFYASDEFARVVGTLGPVKDKLSKKALKQYEDALKRLSKK
jgi:tetratricopeptide (TPR) repeat protein